MATSAAAAKAREPRVRAIAVDQLSTVDIIRGPDVASKKALKAYCRERGWSVAFIAGATGAQRNGIIDAIAFRLCKGTPDLLDVRLIQLKGGNAGITGREIAQLKKATTGVTVKWLITATDGKYLQMIPEEAQI